MLDAVAYFEFVLGQVRRRGATRAQQRRNAVGHLHERGFGAVDLLWGIVEYHLLDIKIGKDDVAELKERDVVRVVLVKGLAQMDGCHGGLSVDQRKAAGERSHRK